MGRRVPVAVIEALRYPSRWIHRGRPGPRLRAEAMSTPGEATGIRGEATHTQPCTGGQPPRIKATGIKGTPRDTAVQRTMNNPGHEHPHRLVRLGPVVQILHRS